MHANVGTIDRLLRLALGVILILIPFVIAHPMVDTPVVRFGVPAVGVILILTALFRFCPLYRIVGLRTCRS